MRNNEEGELLGDHKEKEKKQEVKTLAVRESRVESRATKKGKKLKKYSIERGRTKKKRSSATDSPFTIKLHNPSTRTLPERKG